MTYCTVDEVLNVAGITTTEVSEDTVKQHILAAEAEVDRISNTTWWKRMHEGTATSATSTTLTDTSLTLTTNQEEDNYVYITGGTGVGQLRRISSNTADTLTVASAWDTTPSTDSTYEIIHTGTNPQRTEVWDHTSAYGVYGPKKEYFADKYPIVVVNSLTIDSTSVTPSSLYLYSSDGRIALSADTEESRFSGKPQGNSMVYLFGIRDDRFNQIVRQLTAVIAGLSTLSTQMGGTHNIPSTISMPEGSVTIGQAYVNIKGTRDTLEAEYKRLKALIPKFPYLKL